jgi:hypothetical protein
MTAILRITHINSYPFNVDESSLTEAMRLVEKTLLKMSNDSMSIKDYNNMLLSSTIIN